MSKTKEIARQKFVMTYAFREQAECNFDLTMKLRFGLSPTIAKFDIRTTRENKWNMMVKFNINGNEIYGYNWIIEPTKDIICPNKMDLLIEEMMIDLSIKAKPVEAKRLLEELRRENKNEYANTNRRR